MSDKMYELIPASLFVLLCMSAAFIEWMKDKEDDDDGDE